MFTTALKNSEAFKTVKRDIDKNSLSHAYMLITPDSVAARELFSLIACAVYCHDDVCLKCSACKKVLNKNHSDIVYLNAEGQGIKVDDIKDLIEDTSLKPFESDHKLYFIYGADKMAAVAQNKLLKTLEEPPTSVTIFLGVEKESAMLETIKSRTKKVYLDRFSQDTIFDEIFQETRDEKKSRIAALCSDGMLGKAVDIAKGTAYETNFEIALNILLNMKKSSDVASFLGDKTLSLDNLPILFDTLSLLIRDIMVYKTNPSWFLQNIKLWKLNQLRDIYGARALGNILYLIKTKKGKNLRRTLPRLQYMKICCLNIEVNYRVGENCWN